MSLLKLAPPEPTPNDRAHPHTGLSLSLKQTNYVRITDVLTSEWMTIARAGIRRAIWISAPEAYTVRGNHFRSDTRIFLLGLRDDDSVLISDAVTHAPLIWITLNRTGSRRHREQLLFSADPFRFIIERSDMKKSPPWVHHGGALGRCEVGVIRPTPTAEILSGHQTTFKDET